MVRPYLRTRNPTPPPSVIPLSPPSRCPRIPSRGRGRPPQPCIRLLSGRSRPKRCARAGRSRTLHLREVEHDPSVGAVRTMRAAAADGQLQSPSRASETTCETSVASATRTMRSRAGPGAVEDGTDRVVGGVLR